MLTSHFCSFMVVWGWGLGLGFMGWGFQLMGSGTGGIGPPGVLGLGLSI